MQKQQSYCQIKVRYNVHIQQIIIDLQNLIRKCIARISFKFFWRPTLSKVKLSKIVFYWLLVLIINHYKVSL